MSAWWGWRRRLGVVHGESVDACFISNACVHCFRAPLVYIAASLAPAALLPACRRADLTARLLRRYAATRLQLCRFACRHQQSLAALLVVELVLCAVWLTVWLLRSLPRGAAAVAAAACSSPTRRHTRSQFMTILTEAAPADWQAAGTSKELRQPLLSKE